MPRRSGLLIVVLVLALAATATATSLVKPSNPAQLRTGLYASAGVESSALYCTGLSDAAGGVQGVVTFLNTERSTRTVAIEIVSDTHHRADATLHLAGRTRATLAPDQLVSGHSFGVSAVIDGGGVVADEVTSGHSSVVPCLAQGETSWYASGLDTTVGSSAALSFYNPTATPAVVNVTINTPSGFAAPASFQGLPVAAHAEVKLNLGGQIVNTRNVGVHVNVVRGTLVIAAVENSLTVGSLDVGASLPLASAWFPRVTTANDATAQIRLSNPGPRPAQVSVHVTLGSFHVPDQSVSVGAFASTDVTITPNPAIPAAGLAQVTLSASEPVVATLAVGTSAGVALTPTPTPGGLFEVADLGVGYATATLTNTSDHAVEVTFVPSFNVQTVGSAADSSPVLLSIAPISVGAHATIDLIHATNHASLNGLALEVRASRPSVIVVATLTSTPVGVDVVVESDGG
ncbi:MAG TPA: DUF5719 family protein [Acidimicrobiales bacterium]|nr:DUF5719 family protein [Acidimicrobiales bacterium]